ncbi:hypothetical protein [Halalkalibacter sp. APA_J-10(15)]|uniref:hypothetical protein n=1 Tax=unclassified Halalkalibacter TaxID=2893063 RepID=UPI001FF44962|nr:hypothetical protein [Halalkalibacter sp. APA_J-10(15)]
MKRTRRLVSELGGYIYDKVWIKEATEKVQNGFLSAFNLFSNGFTRHSLDTLLSSFSKQVTDALIA